MDLEQELLAAGAAGEQPPRKFQSLGAVLVCATGGAAVALTVLCVPFVSPALRRVCLPYVPATPCQVAHVLRALGGGGSSRGATCLDIGSGDGRIVLAAARRGFTAHGVEINPWLVTYSRLSAYYNKLHRDTKFFKKDLWKFDLKPYQNIVIFGVQQMMAELETKLLKEASDGTVIVACRFPLPNLVPVETIGHGVDTVWKYKLKTTITS